MNESHYRIRARRVALTACVLACALTGATTARAQALLQPGASFAERPVAGRPAELTLHLSGADLLADGRVDSVVLTVEGVGLTLEALAFDAGLADRGLAATVRPEGRARTRVTLLPRPGGTPTRLTVFARLRCAVAPDAAYRRLGVRLGEGAADGVYADGRRSTLAPARHLPAVVPADLRREATLTLRLAYVDEAIAELDVVVRGVDSLGGMQAEVELDTTGGWELLGAASVVAGASANVLSSRHARVLFVEEGFGSARVPDEGIAVARLTVGRRGATDLLRVRFSERVPHEAFRGYPLGLRYEVATEDFVQRLDAGTPVADTVSVELQPTSATDGVLAVNVLLRGPVDLAGGYLPLVLAPGVAEFEAFMPAIGSGLEVQPRVQSGELRLLFEDPHARGVDVADGVLLGTLTLKLRGALPERSVRLARRPGDLPPELVTSEADGEPGVAAARLVEALAGYGPAGPQASETMAGGEPATLRLVPTVTAGAVGVVVPEGALGGRVVVRDAQGRHVLTRPVRGALVSLDLGAQTPGVYHVIMLTGDTGRLLARGRVVKQ